MIERLDIQTIAQKIQGINPRARINPPLLEKMYYALHLVEQLQINGLDFIFKGGTSLVLLTNLPTRFSIDIDIITQASQKDIETVLQRICEASGIFFSFELDAKRSYQPDIPKAHYKLFFQSATTQIGDNHILLDVLIEENLYPALREMPLQTSWLSATEPITKVKMPTLEAITGDKLTAFAPNTTGVPYHKEKQTEIIKQMFDIGHLFEGVQDLGVLIESYQNIVQQELAYRASLAGKTEADVLQDTFQTCLDVVQETQDELKKGISIFKNWAIAGFSKDEAIETAGKIAYLVAKILQKDTTPLAKFEAQTMQKKDFLIQHPDYNFLNKKIKNLPNNALFYWYQAIKTLHP
jgi:hypothetical protein